MDEDSVTPGFATTLYSFRVPLWWALLLGMGVFAILRRDVRSPAWKLYIIMFLVCLAICLDNSVYLGYSNAVRQQQPATNIFRAYITFANVSSSAFLFLLLALASGFCITRTDFGPHRAKVLLVPSVVLVTGLVTGAFRCLCARNASWRGVMTKPRLS